MKIIEIRTTQNVVLQYEVAELRDRVLAFLIDISIIFASLLVLLSITSSIFPKTVHTVIDTLILCAFMFYSLAFELLNNGQTPGKMALRIQVIKSTSGRPVFVDYAARWVFRLIDIYLSLGGIATIMITSSSRGQRIGDIVANTAVVRLSPRMNLTLGDILVMHSQNAYTPVFSQARKLIEEDVILIKNTLDRSRQFRNEAHQQAVTSLAKQVAHILDLDPGIEDSRKFLETILRDYVVLTR